MKFERLSLSEWRQFRSVDIHFDPRLTILTGANGSGKTTILNLLARHYAWDSSLIGTPRRRKRGVLQYLSDTWKSLRWTADTEVPQGDTTIGQLIYSNRSQTDLIVPNTTSPQYQISFSALKNVQGLNIPSHRPPYMYRPVKTIPTQPSSIADLGTNYLSKFRQRSITGRGEPPNFHLKETLISLATFGYGSPVVTPNEDYQKTFEEFEEVLRKVMPGHLGFQKLNVDVPEVILVTESGKFTIDAVSGGVASIMEMAWQIFIVSQTYSEFVVTIDEPENHLHPLMQRTLLRDLLKTFPQVQFIVATHNPFIITSTADSNVYALFFDDESRVVSQPLDFADKAASSSQILRDILGMPHTLPIWVEERLDDLVRKYLDDAISSEKLNALQLELEQIGLSGGLFDALERISKEQHDQT